MAALRILVCFLLVGTIAARSEAQTLPAQTVQEISAATKARVRLRAGNWVTIYGPRADSTSLTYRRGEFLNRGGALVQLPPPLPVNRLDSIQISRGSHAGSGAKIGGGIMAGLTVLAIVGCNGTICEPSSGGALAALVVWTAIGAGVGALIGSGSPRWETIYVARGP